MTPRTTRGGHKPRLAGCFADMNRQRYIGPIPHLYGKTAFVRRRAGGPGQVMAQFEEQYLQEARDWWQFSEAEFHSATDESTARFHAQLD
jgi:hypothetical protein